MIQQLNKFGTNKIKFATIYKHYTLYLCILAFLSCKMDKQSFENTRILFEKTELNFGEIPADKNTSVVFNFTNVGKKPLLIKSVKTSCDCTVSKWENREIMPSESGEIKVEINPTYRGMFNSIVEVFYNGEDSPKKLKIKGMVEYLSLID